MLKGASCERLGIRELKQRASQVLREVRERGEEIDVTHHGRVIARLVPVAREPVGRRATGAAWSTIDRLAKEIGSRWPKGRSAAADLGLPLATWDIEQRQRAARIVDVVIPSV